MGEEPSLPPFAEHQPGPSPHPISPPSLHPNGAAHLHSEEEPYTIKCICGFADDDGNTVLCEQCETWQHIECYYYPDLTVPDVHKCVECLPRILDSANATQRQRRLREGVNGNEERKARRAGPKTHKRSKTKEPGTYTTHQVNGLTYNDKLPHDRTSASPRDHPPPSKRPKTSHRNSGSVSNNQSNHGLGHHNRTGSSVIPLASPVKPALADCPPDYFSSEFINVHQTNTHFTPAQANLFLNIGVSDLLSTWLDDPQAFAQATHGKSHADVFKQYPTPIEELETPVQKCIREDTSAEFHGNHPVWPYLVTDRDLFEGHFVGELIGSIGHLEDYKAEPSNNWDRLRHPDHFVFFHPHLPIYIDCRTEGTILRYARRSCRPNIKMETIITGAREYHFCFIATRDIPEGAELTVAWDLESDPQLRDYLYRLSGSSSSLDDSQREYLVRWVETVLAHFGDCACPSFDGMCLMERFDHRVSPIEQPPSSATVQRKKHPSKRSPSGPPRQVNSRAGSEGQFRGGDDDFGETTSSPRSSRSRTSREPTPMSYDSIPHGGPELSERDKKKLLQQEKLFQKIEQEEQGQRKKKRRSGSTLHTPSAATFKQQGRSYFSNSNPDTPASGNEARLLDNDMSYFNSNSASSPDSRLPPPEANASDAPQRYNTSRLLEQSARPTYADASAQTEAELPLAVLSSNASTERRPYISLSQRLLRRNHLNRLRTEENSEAEINNYQNSSLPGLPPSHSIGAMSYMGYENGSRPKSMVSQSIESERNDLVPPLVARATTELESGVNVTDGGGAWHLEHSVEPPQPSSTPLKSPARAPLTDASEIQDPDIRHRNNYRAANFHVDLPPSEFQSTIETSSPAAAAAIGTVLAGNTVHSPLSAGSVAPMSAPIATMAMPMLTPNHSNITQPSPVKKKMSLSDYSQRLKAKTPSVEKNHGLGQARSTSPSTAGPRGSSVSSGTGEATQQVLADSDLGAVKKEPETPQF